MPFIQILPLSYYVLNNRWEDLEILRRHNIHITAPELKIDDIIDANFDEDNQSRAPSTLGQSPLPSI